MNPEEEKLWKLISDHHGLIGKLDDRSRAVEEEVARLALEDARSLKVVAAAIKHDVADREDMAQVLTDVATRWEQFWRTREAS
jgi:hypothetical protein